MARMTLGDVASLPAEGPITVCEPACGAGAMILSFAEACPPDVRRRLRVTAIDISRTACDMAFINTTLWGVSHASHSRQFLVAGILGCMVEHPLHHAVATSHAVSSNS
jgi:methylase of polypeptide subunit release factors